jgi:putative FmdB family regulatory protein
MEQYVYEIECAVCDSITKVLVPYDDDKPECCPMCGEDASVEFLGDSDVIL